MTNYQSYDVAVMNYPLFLEQKANMNLEEMVQSPNFEMEYEVPIYIHIPFCENLCRFCIYNRMKAKEGSNSIEEYVKALIREIKLYASHEEIQKLKVGSVFIGGGTPTILNHRQLSELIYTLSKCFKLDDCEITVECNAQNADKSKLQLLKDLGVDRISTGIQTFQDTLRKRLNISNDSTYISRWLEEAARLNFKEISTDIIYGFPDMNEQQVINDIDKALRLPISHLSLYKLTTFAYTQLYQDVRQGKTCLPSYERVEKMFYQAHDYLLKKGFTAQSTQEYGKNERVRFWDQTYDGYGNNLSFGLSSFGYLNGFCYQNERRVLDYIKKVETNQLPIERISPKITEEQLLERAMVIGFRKGEVSDTMFHQAFGKHIMDVFADILARQIEEGFVYKNNELYRLTPKGYFHQGHISVDYMVSVFRGVSPLRKKMCIGEHRMP